MDDPNMHAYGEEDFDDAEIGRQWREDSSLEKWFPITAERLAALEAENAALRATPAPSVGADGLPTDLWALVRAYGDCRADVAVNSRDASAAQYLKLAESNLRDALAALASRPVGDGGADNQRIDAIDRWLRKQRNEGYQWDTMSFSTTRPAREQLDERFPRTAGTDTAGGV